MMMLEIDAVFDCVKERIESEINRTGIGAWRLPYSLRLFLENWPVQKHINPSIPALMCAADMFNCSVDYLLGRTDEEPGGAQDVRN